MTNIKKVLVVDDNLDLLPIFGYLADDEIEFLVAANGLDAISIVEECKESIDAVLLDLSMPTLDGIAVVEEIRRNEQMHPNRPAVRLAFFTAQMVDGVIERVQEENNVERVFHKPFDASGLVKNIKEWLA